MQTHEAILDLPPNGSTPAPPRLVDLGHYPFPVRFWRRSFSARISAAVRSSANRFRFLPLSLCRRSFVLASKPSPVGQTCITSRAQKHLVLWPGWILPSSCAHCLQRLVKHLVDDLGVGLSPGAFHHLPYQVLDSRLLPAHVVANRLGVGLYHLIDHRLHGG